MSRVRLSVENFGSGDTAEDMADVVGRFVASLRSRIEGHEEDPRAIQAIDSLFLRGVPPPCGLCLIPSSILVS